MIAIEALKNLFLPEEQRTENLAQRKIAWEKMQTAAKKEWPLVLNSPTGRALLKERYVASIREKRILLALLPIPWIALGLIFPSWRIALFGYLISVPILLALPLWGEYLQMKRERRDTLLRRGVPDELI